MRAQNSAVMLSACAALACGTSTELPNARPSQPVEERVQPIQAARAPQLPAAPPPSTATSEQVKVDGALLTLEGCQLTVEASGTTQKHALPLPDGCTFGKRKAGGPVQIETTKHGATVLVVSSKLVAGRECDTHIRAIVVGKKGLGLSSREQLISMCGADGPFEDPTFITLAASSKPLN